MKTSAVTFIAVLSVLVGWLIWRGSPSPGLIASPTNSTPIPGILELYRPWPVRLLNGIGSVLQDDLGIDTAWLVGLTEEGLFKTACASIKMEKPPNECTGKLEDSDKTFRRGLKALVKSINEDANLNLFGCLLVKNLLTRALRTQFVLANAWEEQSTAELTEPILDPVVIVGLPRTGTTALLNLLNQDESLRSPLLWELADPLPSFFEGGSDMHIAFMRLEMWVYSLLAPGLFERMHPQDPMMPDELVVAESAQFVTYGFLVLFNVPGFQEWLSDNVDPVETTQFNAMFLRLLQQQNTKKNNGKQRWLLKSPPFLGMLESIRHVYPNASFVFTHRRPDEAMASISSLSSKQRGLFSDHVDLAMVAQQHISRWEPALKQYFDVIDEWEGDESIKKADVYISDIKKDSIGTVESIYKELGMELTAETRENIMAWQQKQGKDASRPSQAFVSGRHQVKLDSFGIDNEMMYARPSFREYCLRFPGLKCDLEDDHNI